MQPVTPVQRIYYAAVCALALWVGYWGYFVPARVNKALPWLVQPLCSRFLGAMYLSGATFMLGCLFAHRWAEVRVVVPMIAIWTGMLLVVSLLHLGAFDYARPQTWVWFVAYVVFPLIALWLTWRHRRDATDLSLPGQALSAWVRHYLLAQGSVLTLLAVTLLLAPGALAPSWPWRVSAVMVQLYSAPFLAYGLGSLALARQRSWPEIRVAVPAMFVFAVGVLLASLIHHTLFSAGELGDWFWFAGFTTATATLGLLTGRALQPMFGTLRGRPGTTRRSATLQPGARRSG